MLKITKKVDDTIYTVIGEKEFNHQSGWTLKEPSTIKKGKTVVRGFYEKAHVLNKISSVDILSAENLN